jgi:hypothetical protein
MSHPEEQSQLISSPSEPTEFQEIDGDPEFETEEVLETAKRSLDFLAALAMPDVYKYAFPPIFLSIWEWIKQNIHLTRKFPQLALGLPRGFGKTLVVKLIILYAILFTKKQFILVICENEEKAKAILSDVEDMLDEPNIKATFGDWRLGMGTNTQVRKVFAYRGRNIILKAAGAGTGIRGITEKNRRPDLMVFDDIQSREDSESEILASSLEKWMVGTAMKAKSPEGCLYLFIANMYPTKGSLLRKIKSNPNWVKYIVGGILADGTSLWEDLQPIEQLLREFQNDLSTGHPEIFYAEVLNDENASLNNLVDLSKIPDWTYKDDDIDLGQFIIIDPSGNRQNSDSVAIGRYRVFDGYPCLVELIERQLSPGETIMEALNMGLRANCFIIGVESTGYQQTLLYWFQFTCTQLGIQDGTFEFLEVHSGMREKNMRIVSMFKQLPTGEIKLHPSVRPQIYTQITQYNPLRRDNVDNSLDCLTYGPKMLELYGVLIYNKTVIAEQDFNAHEVVEYNSPF